MFYFEVVFIIKPYKKYQKILIFLLPFISLFSAYIISIFIFHNNISLPKCYVYELTGLYCPGCGCTRSVYALVHGDILLSLRENVLPVMMLVVLSVLYIELLFRAFGKRVRSIIRNKYFMWGVMIFFAVYTILRNIFPVLAPVDIM